MGIDIYARWSGQTNQEKEAQITGFDATVGGLGYLREAYHGGPYATKYLLREAFAAKKHRATIRAKVLRERLPLTLDIVRYRNRKVYGGAKGEELPLDESVPAVMQIADTLKQKGWQPVNLTDYDPQLEEEIVQSFTDFVELCERKEAETGKPVTIIASY